MVRRIEHIQLSSWQDVSLVKLYCASTSSMEPRIFHVLYSLFGVSDLELSFER